MIRALTLAALLALAPASAHAFCKLALGLGLDISSSVSAEEYRLQLEGLANALETPEVIEAILTPEGAHIAAAAYEWSGYQQQDMIADWRILDSPADVRAFAAELRAHQRPYWDFATAIGKGIEYGAYMMRRAPVCGRQVLDISGDGENNVGVDPAYFYGIGLLDDIVVNGLVIRGANPDPLPYYGAQVVHGPGAFLTIADDFNDYLRAIKEKLLREIAVEMILGDLAPGTQ